MFMEARLWDDIMLQIGRQRLQPGRDPVPLIQRRLQARRDMASVGIPGEIVRYDHQLPIATHFQRGKFHVYPFASAAIMAASC
jgi:hypothetical protein